MLTHHNQSVSLLLLLLLFHVLVTLAQRRPTVPAASCSRAHSCMPWETETGPSCQRGNHIGFRFALDIAREDRTKSHQFPASEGGMVCGMNTGPETPHYLTYAFCPKVDELLAFNLTNSGKFAGTHLRKDVERVETAGDAWLRVYGFGTKEDRFFPQRENGTLTRAPSAGAVQVVGACPTGESTRTAIVPFLILNVTLEKGKFRYYSDHPQPAGVGFAPSCEQVQNVDVCTLDSSMACLGPEGQKNCAICYDSYNAATSQVSQLVNTHIKVWTAFFGEDAKGRRLRSGADSPLSFRKYAGGSMWTNIETGVNKATHGNYDDPDDPSV